MTERPLRRYGSPTWQLCWQVGRLVRSVFSVKLLSKRRQYVTQKRPKINRLARRVYSRVVFISCGKHDMTVLIFRYSPFWPQSCSSNQHFHVWLKFTSVLWFIVHNGRSRQGTSAPWSRGCSSFIKEVWRYFQAACACICFIYFYIYTFFSQFLRHHSKLPDKVIRGQAPASVCPRHSPHIGHVDYLRCYSIPKEVSGGCLCQNWTWQHLNRDLKLLIMVS